MAMQDGVGANNEEGHPSGVTLVDLPMMKAGLASALLLLAADRVCEVGTGGEADALVRRNGHPLTGLAPADGAHLALLDLAGLERAEAREDDAVARCQGFANAIEHGVECRIALRAWASQLAGNLCR